MNLFRGIGLVVLLVGLGLLGYGIWYYFDSRSEVRIGDARLVVEDAEVHPTVWVGGVLVLAGGIVAGAARNKKS